MGLQEIIDKHLKEFHDVQGLKVPIELNSYLHKMINEALHMNDSCEKLTTFRKIVKHSIGSEIFKEIEKEFKVINLTNNK